VRRCVRRGAQPGVVAVELLVVLGLFVVVVGVRKVAPAPWWARSARTRICWLRQAWAMPWARAALRS
jgi:hypothetical protein